MHLIGGASRPVLEPEVPRFGEGSDLDVTETGQSSMLANGQTLRRKVVFKKTKGSKLHQKNAERYKDYEEKKIKYEDKNFGFSDGETRGKKGRFNFK